MNILRKYTQKIRGEMRILWKSIRYSPLIMSDREFDIKRFYKKFGDYPDIENPKTFNEKILYKKLYDRNPLLQTAADKYRVRDYVAERIGEKYLTKLYLATANPNEIDFTALPPSFAIKASHGSAMGKLVFNQNTIDKEELVKICRVWLKKNYYYAGREWCYKKIVPMIIVEELLLENGKIPNDYKLFCFHRKVRLITADYDRYTQTHSRNLFSEKGKLLDIIKGINNNPSENKLPRNYKEMIRLAEILSQPFDFVRADFYNIKGRIIFGEMTHYPGNAITEFEPAEFNLTMGGYWRLEY